MSSEAYCLFGQLLSLPQGRELLSSSQGRELMNFHSQPVAADSVLSSQLPNLMHHPPSTQQSLPLSSQPSLPPSSQLSGRVPLQSSVLQPSTTLNQPIQASSLSPQPLVPLSSQLSGMVPLQSSVFHSSTTLNQSIQASSLFSQPISPSVPSDSTAQGSQPQPPVRPGSK
ncbi:hypothetical protein F5051DRAFT_476821 [Lentinula edodes]|nr:hypothetical protein F5051DRAFT_476821 [Lentinula edodes]